MNLLEASYRLRLRAKWLKYIIRPKYQPASPIFFIHIPKTAGTSFRNMLFRLIDPRSAFPNFDDLAANQGKYPPLATLSAALSDTRRDIRFLTGHYPFAAGELLPIPRQYFVFVREPVARTISNLLHFQRNDPECRSLSLLEIFNKYRPHLQNLQTRFLCEPELENLEVFYQSSLLSQQQLEQAKANLEKCTFVGITEKFSDSVEVAEQLLGAKLGYPLKSNVAQLAPDQPDIGELIRQVRPYLDLDLDLYQHALTLFTKQQSLILNR